jgi:U4/U6.U5 tri-snRNP-associated protein 2
VWKVQLRAGRGENEKWFQIQDLIVEEMRKEMIFLGETVIQVPISPHGYPALLIILFF